MESTTTPNLHPGETLFRRRFLAGECLYRDTLGRRVLADVEGSGTWAFEGSASVVPLVDGANTPNRSGDFQFSLRFIAEDDGEAEVLVASPENRDLSNGVSVSLPYQGCGWLVEAGEPVFGDGSPDPLPQGAPFFMELRGGGAAKIVPAQGRWVPLESDIPLKGLSRPHPENGCRSVLNELVIDFIAPNDGPVRLMRTYDRFHGRQRARVFVGGEPVGWWRDSVEDRQSRVAISSFGLFVFAGPQRITLLPQPGSALWSFREVAVLAWVP
ncbi:hypothetical protein EON79_01545 [bacterium]|nr:MAG: hypothetical protein EON79_01545 [bacterium]